MQCCPPGMSTACSMYCHLNTEGLPYSIPNYRILLCRNNQCRRDQRCFSKVSHRVQARLARRPCSNAIFPIIWCPGIRADVHAYRIRFLSKLRYGRHMSLIIKAAGYEVSFLVDAMVCSCTMHDGSWNTNIRHMSIEYRIFNDNIIVLRNTRRRFSKLWIMKIRGSRRKLKPIY